MIREVAKTALAAAVLFAANGLVNLALLKPLEGASEPLNLLRSHLDDGIFILLFGLLAGAFAAMFAVLPRERGYLYLGVMSFMTSLLLFSEWQGKELLFGPFPEVPVLPLAVKSGIVFIGFSFFSYLIGSESGIFARSLTWCNGLLWAAVLAFAPFPEAETALAVLSGVFFVLVLLNIAHSLSLTLTKLRRKEARNDFRQVASGLVLFLIVLLPDPGKDLLETLTGRSIGYRRVYWEQCLEDTLPWALLSLLASFGTMFFQRFVHTLRTNKTITEELISKNAVLGQEIAARERLDRMLSAMLRAYRVADLEQAILREGRDYFFPRPFFLVKYDETSGRLRWEGNGQLILSDEETASVLRAAKTRSSAGEIVAASSIALGFAGSMGEGLLLLAVHAGNEEELALGERDKFTLSLMSKYAAIFLEYFRLAESRLQELQQAQTERAPWASKLFLQIAEKERRRLASDLHDEALQELLHIRRIAERLPDDPRFREDKERVRLGLDNAEYMIRETCRELMPPLLTDRGALRAISDLVEKTRLRAGFRLNYRVGTVTAPLGDEQNTAVYRIVQELIGNAMKHSQAESVGLAVAQEGKELHIEYEDNGKGMELDGETALMSDRFGLRGMAERVRMLGGEIAVRSAPGQGVRVKCTLPLTGTKPA